MVLFVCPSLPGCRFSLYSSPRSLGIFQYMYGSVFFSYSLRVLLSQNWPLQNQPSSFHDNCDIQFVLFLLPRWYSPFDLYTFRGSLHILAKTLLLGGSSLNKSSKNEPSLEVLAARFAYASAAVLTLSDMLGTISAGLALRLVEEAMVSDNPSANSRTNSNSSRNSSSNSSNNSIFSVEVEQMQRQMDELILEMKRLKKMMT